VFKIVRKTNEYFGEKEKLETVLLKFAGYLKNPTLYKLEGKYTFNIIQMEIIPRFIYDLPSRQKRFQL